jgi:3-phenylpropionate/trans-cinnamate dioxygenase ferredoxin reductase subunit
MSDDYELLVVGGGPAGLSAARAYRDAAGRGAVAIVADEERMPYDRPPLTKELLRGEMDQDELALEDEAWLSEQGVSLIAGRAVALAPDRHEVVLSGGRCLNYRACVLATGAEPRRLPIPGADDPAVRVVRSLSQVRELLARLTPGDGVVVIGSGFIGCEIAASLSVRGHAVTLVSDEPSPNQARLGADAGATIAGWLRELGVTLMLGSAVERIERRGGELHLSAGSHHPRASVVVMATGVTPRSELVLGAGIALRDGAITVDSSMRTVVDGVLAAGDVTYAENAAAGRHLHVEHWGDALGQGSVAGRTAAGVSAAWSDIPGFWSAIGANTLKYAAWGDGYEIASLQRASGGDGFAVWYSREGRLVGVLAHNADDSYERGRELIAQGAPWPT